MITVTDSGIFVSVRPQLLNAPSPIERIEFGKSKSTNALHPEKALLPIVSNPSGVLTELRLLHAQKDWLPIYLIESGNTMPYKSSEE